MAVTLVSLLFIEVLSPNPHKQGKLHCIFVLLYTVFRVKYLNITNMFFYIKKINSSLNKLVLFESYKKIIK